MTGRRLLVPLVLVVLIPLALPASASYGPTRLARSCTGNIRLAAVGGGVVWGATSCGRQLGAIGVISARSAGSWRRSSTPWTGDVLAVADDGGTTFVLWNDANGRLQIGRRPHAGPASAPTLLSRQGSTGASLVARDGRWWAVWSTSGCTGHMEGCSTVMWQAKSLGRGLRAEQVLAKPDPAGTADVFAGLALRGDEAILVFLRRDGNGDVIHYATADLDGIWTDGLFPPAVGVRTAFAPAITVAVQRVIVGWVRDQRPVVSMKDGGGDFVTAALPYRAQASQVVVAASGGRAFAGHHACFEYHGAWTCRAYVSTLTADGTVTGTTDLSAGTAPGATWFLDDLVAAGGVATAAVSTANALVTRSGF
jgi:hypothetical protein